MRRPCLRLPASFGRLERKVPEAPQLLEPVVKAIDEALNALAEAQNGIEQAIRAIDFDPRVLEQTEERLFALRAAARNIRLPSMTFAALRDRMDADLADIDAGAERLAALEKEAAGGTRCL